MGDLKARLSNARVKLLRKHTGGVPLRPSTRPESVRSDAQSHDREAERHQPHPPASLQLLPEPSPSPRLDSPNDISEKHLSLDLEKHEDQHRSSDTISDHRTPGSESLNSVKDQPPLDGRSISVPTTDSPKTPAVTIQEATPDQGLDLTTGHETQLIQTEDSKEAETFPPKFQPPSAAAAGIPSNLQRQQSVVASSNARILDTLLKAEKARHTPGSLSADYFSSGPLSISASMLQRKIWVKRPGGSATQVQIKEDDLVDDVRDMILRKYANSLGRSFDAPDITMRIMSREPNQKGTERVLGPEEEMCRTLDAYYPGGQSVEEALLIDVPQRRTPRPSPHAIHPPHLYHYENARPAENGTEYFPPMPAPSPAALTSGSHESRASHAPHERSMSVLNTGSVPPLPSPGGTRRLHHIRPKHPRQHTSSPTAVTATAPVLNSVRPARLRHDSSASESIHAPPVAPPLSTPPAPESTVAKPASTPPVQRVSSPRPGRRKRPKPTSSHESPTLPAGLLDGSVPPINVLIVEDNIINLRVLGAFMERLKVRWQRAMNGREAVIKWRSGGFHLVLMDIQLPIMNGLEATKEIRRLERVNNIGVFSSASSDAPDLGPDGTKELQEEDKLGDKLLFKSPVIIVALTASSLQSDRHEALAAGCNDFLTKPVNFVWLERKVKEWGCMQALIDFDGWRKWKDFASQSDSSKDESRKNAAGAAKKKKDAAMKEGAAKDKSAGLKKDAVEGGGKAGDGIKENHQASISAHA